MKEVVKDLNEQGLCLRPRLVAAFEESLPHYGRGTGGQYLPRGALGHRALARAGRGDWQLWYSPLWDSSKRSECRWLTGPTDSRYSWCNGRQGAAAGDRNPR